MREARWCRWCTHSFYSEFVKFHASGVGSLKPAEKVSDDFLASFVVGSRELVDAAV
jgi:hypothetical protein